MAVEGDAGELGGVVKVIEEGISDVDPDEVKRVSADCVMVEGEGVSNPTRSTTLFLYRLVAIGLTFGSVMHERIVSVTAHT